MKVTLSPYLKGQKELLKKLVEELSREFKYASVLGVDTVGKQYRVQMGGTTLGDAMWVERGFVVRVHNGKNYSEFSFNSIKEEDISNIVKDVRNSVKEPINILSAAGVTISSYPVIEEEKIEKSFYGEVVILPEEVNAKDKIKRLIDIKNKAMEYCDKLVNIITGYEEVHVSKVFISSNKNLEQSYIWGVGTVIPIVRKGDITKYYFNSYSGLKAVEILDEMEKNFKEPIDIAVKLLDAKPAIPGEYEAICSPEVSGLIAHEAFGHGVEMDMFVKNRAKAPEFLGKAVASELVTMHDGATAAKEVSSYLFDDEGVIGKDTIIINEGILQSGISDILSALRLGTVPTGNGKRESFERKAYSRMTNTFFAPGKDKLEDMIASIKHGYMIDGMMSGMEDPKNWGIQCVCSMGREIKDGKFTGNIISPVLMTGYVPDLLKSISRVSDTMELFGAGICGKGYKEYVKASDGGPYIKARVRLG